MGQITEPLLWSSQLFECRAFVSFTARVSHRLNYEILKVALTRADLAHPWAMRSLAGDLLPSMRPLQAMPISAREMSGGSAVEVCIFTVEPPARLRHGQVPAYYNNMGLLVRALSLYRLEGVATVGLAWDDRPEPYCLACPEG